MKKIILVMVLVYTAACILVQPLILLKTKHTNKTISQVLLKELFLIFT